MFYRILAELVPYWAKLLRYMAFESDDTYFE